MAEATGDVKNSGRSNWRVQGTRKGGDRAKGWSGVGEGPGESGQDKGSFGAKPVTST